MRPFDWTELRDLAKGKEFSFDRYKGSHYIMTKDGVPRPVVIPMRKELKEDVVMTVARAIGMTRSDLEDYVRSGGGSSRSRRRR